MEACDIVFHENNEIIYLKNYRAKILSNSETLPLLEVQSLEVQLDVICKQLVALALKPPSEYARPITHWTASELADEIRIQGIAPGIVRIQ